MTRRSTSLLVIGLAALGLLFIAPDVFLVVFAGLLLAVFIHGGGHWIASRLGLGDGWGIAIFVVAIIAVLAAFSGAVAPAVVDEIDQLTQRLPEALGQLRRRVAEYSWGERLLDRITPEGMMSSGGRTAATSAVTSTFGALGNFVIILFIGLYGALDPGLYRRGAKMLLAPSMRPRAEEVMAAVGDTLRNWLTAQLMAMTMVGVLTALGLWLAGVPLHFALGLIAGLLGFIPNIGPIIAAAPALLLAFPEGMNTVLIVLAIYAAVQALEGYVVTPLIQQEKVSLPPVVIIVAQLLFGVLFGILGLALATPIAALAMTLVREVYVEDYLEHEAAGVQADDGREDNPAGG
ncbi:MAG: AI-2E family transporter [Pseudaminobacter sp.]|nr:AI-2E family transporter [Pseudaminobacter sp.]